MDHLSEATISIDNLDTGHNLMNYSMPNSMTSLELSEEPIIPIKRQIQNGDVHTRIRQLEHDMEQLTLSNVKLQRANRKLKLECDQLIDEQTKGLRDEMKALKEMNVQLQRSNRLLMDDMTVKNEEISNLKNDHIRQMKNVGPEYEYLVQIIHLLYRQLDGKISCDKTCCYTNLPLSQGRSVLTLPPEESKDQKPEAAHLCRPIIHSNISSGDLATSLQKENNTLKQEILKIKSDHEELYHLISEKDEITEVLKSELRMKDAIVTQLEKDFERMELEVLDLQKDWHYPDRIKSESSFSDIHHAFPLPPSMPKDHDDNISISHTLSSSSSPCSPVSEYFPS
ncbi:unnamed protein product [Cunninghamella blakesleeana]